jgi:hypothetical protein
MNRIIKKNVSLTPKELNLNRIIKKKRFPNSAPSTRGNNNNLAIQVELLRSLKYCFCCFLFKLNSFGVWDIVFDVSIHT